MKIRIEVDGTKEEVKDLKILFSEDGSVIQSTSSGVFGTPKTKEKAKPQPEPINEFDPDSAELKTSYSSEKVLAPELEIPEITDMGVDESFAEGEW